LGCSRDPIEMSRPRTLQNKNRRVRAALGVLPDDLCIQIELWPRAGRPHNHGVKTWRDGAGGGLKVAIRYSRIANSERQSKPSLLF
jgi:hypothetical protein